ncbi:MAG: imidazolonepropionase [Bacteriovoracaceae bacterium]|nr:imidazolonepropionase [Bacteriovoracaceae bacterium]
MGLTLLKNIKECVTLQGVAKKQGRHLIASDLCIMNETSIVHDGNQILWVGKTGQIPHNFVFEIEIDLTNSVVLPGMIDCHTHLVFGGDRSHEYFMRLNGSTYEEIAASGGGILSTANATRAMDASSLKQQAIARVDRLAERGVVAIEIKSGYGLTRDSERKLSQIIGELKRDYAKKGIKIINTYMAAHAIPPEYGNSRSHDYMLEVVIPLLDELSQNSLTRPDFVDIFLEDNYFNQSDANILFQKCSEFNIPFKAHVDELKNSGNLKYAVESGAISCEHMLYSDEVSIKSLAQSDTVGVLLPGTAFFLGKKMAPARAMLDAGCRLAIGSDFNPGSCHWDDVFKIAIMSAPTLKMNVAEILSAVTYNAAQALELPNYGFIEVGSTPRLSIFRDTSLQQLFYRWSNT